MSDETREKLNCAEIAFMNGQYDTALELCNKVIFEEPSNPDAQALCN